MAIEAIKGAGMTYQGSSSTTVIKEETQAKVNTEDAAIASEQLARDTHNVQMNETSADGQDSNQSSAQQKTKEQIKKAVDDINKKAMNSEAIFGIHEGTNRVTIKIVDKETKEVIKELPPEKTLDMIARIWDMAGILVDEKR